MATVRTGHEGWGERRPAPPRRFRVVNLVGPVVVLLLVAGTVWRFTTVSSDESVAAAARPTTLDEELATLEASSREHPDDPAVWQRLGVVYAALAHQNADPTLYARAEAAFDRADTIVPDAAGTLVARATVQAVKHQFSEARQLASAALVSNPLNANALVVLVDAQVELGDYESAAVDLQTLLDHKPGMAALARASYLRELHGDLDGALLALHQAEAAGAQASTPDRALTMRIRADVLFNHGRIDEAAAVYREILELEAGYPDARIGLARVDAVNGRTDHAIESLRELLREVDDPHGWIALADIQAFAGRTGELPASLAKVRELMTIEETNGSSIDLELALFDADHDGDPVAFVARAERGYRARPSVHGADALAWALHQAGRSAEAVPYVEEAVRLGSVDATIRYHAAEVFTAVGDESRGRVELQRALAINPWAPLARHDDVRALAARLGVTPPPSWR